MRQPLVLAAVALSTVASSQLVVLPFWRDAPAPAEPVHSQPASGKQIPLMDPAGPGPAIPGPVPAQPPSDAGGEVVLSDVMGRDRSINLFAGFIRDVETATRRLEDSSKNTMVLAPLNSAIEKLPRKPWEDPRDYGALGPNAYEGGDGQERAQKNLRRFVEAHMLPVSPWSEGEKATSIGDDRSVWWEEKDGKRVIQPGDIEVVNMASSVSNGQLWIIKNVRNYA